MIEEVLKDYCEEMPGVSYEHVKKLRMILSRFDHDYLSECTDDEMHYAYLAAFLCRLERLDCSKFEDENAVFQDENVQFYLEMDDEEKRLDAKPFRRNNTLLRKVLQIRLELLRISMEKVLEEQKTEDIDLVRRYQEEIPQLQEKLSSLKFSDRRKAEQLLSNSLLDIAYVLEDARRYSPEMYEFSVRSGKNRQ